MRVGKYKELLLNIALFALNTISTKLITFLLVPLYTYFLTAAQFGITDMSLTVLGLISPIVTLSVGDAVTRYVIDDSREKERYISVGFWVTVIGCVVMLVILPILDLPLFGGLGDYKWYYMIYFITLNYNGYLGNVARGLDRIKLMAAASIASSLVSASSASVLIGVLGWETEGYFVSLVLGGLTSICMYLLIGHFGRYVGVPKYRNDEKYIKRMLLYAIPLIPNSIFWWVGTGVNRFFITAMLGIGSSGFFAAASKIPNILNLVSSTFWQAWSLSAFQQFKKDDTSKFYSNVFVVFRSLCFVVASGLVLGAPWLASLLLQKNFYEAWIIVPPLILAFLFNAFAGFYGTVFTASMKTTYLLTSTVVASMVVVVMTWFLIPIIGLSGAAWALVASNFVMYIMRVFRSSTVIIIHVNWPLMISNTLLLILQICAMVNRVNNYMTFSAVVFIGVCILSFLDFYPSFKVILNIAKMKSKKR
ncbi:multidrug transporter [Bifidobacterium pseudolongum subsp. globosum]|uniref:Multidrug transporter n=2 Tax=Bifidobacterium pseudolongum TaxID=1694 RepID=A0A4Q5A025_9BIFI|nr:multidrug transporter [Bifidobacterium pseudolongum subsp. globosum]